MMRRTTASRGYVVWPQCQSTRDDGTGYYDTQEGGMECWAVLIAEGGDIDGPSVRNVCLTGFSMAINTYDAIVTDWGAYAADIGMAFDLAVCIGATGTSPAACGGGGYWQATAADLTEEGRQLLALLEKLYGVAPSLMMVLDT